MQGKVMPMPKYHVIMMYEGMEAVVLALYGGNSLASRSGRFKPDIYCVGTRDGLDIMVKREIPTPTGN